MEYKSLTKEQIIISIDRLTRFKNTKDKYQRVFFDILTNNLLEPKLKKKDIEKLPTEEIVNYVTEIFNNSCNNNCNQTLNTPTPFGYFPLKGADIKREDIPLRIGPFGNFTVKGTDNENFVINKKLKDYENSIFNNDEETQTYLNNKINYYALINYVDNKCCTNLLWLKSLADTANTDLIKSRETHYLKYPIEKVILAEGITEETLLPAFSKYLGYDFYQNGIHIIGAGGKNQVVKMYYKLADELKIPIFVLLDKDAKENIGQISPKLRKQDKIHLVSCGEFEDILPKTLIVKTVNKHFENFLQITEQDLDKSVPTAKILEELFKTKGLHEFKKADFAKLVKENISEYGDISEEISLIVSEVASLNT